MKYLVLIGDGMSDLPVKELKGKTPLEAAQTPNMDFMAQQGDCGWTLNVPAGLPPGSDVAAVSIFGYDPRKCYTGRGPLEAASLGVRLKKGEVAFRLNLVTVKDGRMDDFTSGHISTAEARKIIATLDKKLGSKDIRFYPGLSYRHLLIIRNSSLEISNSKCTPPHDITGKMIDGYLPQGPGAGLLKHLMKESIMPLFEHPVNIRRIRNGKKPASMIWLWGQGAEPAMKSFQQQYKKSAAVITAVHLLKGLGKILGMDVIMSPGPPVFSTRIILARLSMLLKLLRNTMWSLCMWKPPTRPGIWGTLRGRSRQSKTSIRKLSELF